MFNNLKNKIISSSIFLAPALSLGAGADFKSVSQKLYSGIFSSIISFLITLAFVFFAWSIFRFILAEGDKKVEAKETLLWGAVALFVMVSFWGILRIVNNTFTTDELGDNQPYNFESDYKKYTPPQR